jgi:hypothetical protein
MTPFPKREYPTFCYVRTFLPSVAGRDNLALPMHEHDQPAPISSGSQRMRIQRIAGIGSDLRFVGTVEYRHVYSQSGGAQYCTGPSAEDDIIVVYAEAFERDANPDDFSLEAMIAHECGHQRLIREPNLRGFLAKFPGEALEEILASIVGSILLGETESSKTLVWKATAELGDMSMASEGAVQFVERLRRLLRNFL